MKKTNKLLIVLMILILVILFIFAACEPISVSINTKGDIAFTRTEGVFYYNIKKQKIEILDWNFGNETVPVIVRWSPDDNSTAVTVKDNKDSQSTSVFIIDNKGKKRKLYSSEKTIMQMEWSANGNFLSIAHPGKDTNLNVADIVLINVSDGMSKIAAENVGDVHRWIDDKNIVLMKISQSNKDNSDMLMGELVIKDVSSNNDTVCANVIVSKTGGIDYSDKNKIILFSAVQADGNKLEFVKDMVNESFGYSYNIKNKELSKVIDKKINFLKFSPDQQKVLLKAKNDETYKTDLIYYDFKSKDYKTLVADTVDTISANSMSVQAYPAWLDNNTVIYWDVKNVYGSNGQAVQLMTIDLSTLKKNNHQPFIDYEIHKMIEQKGGY